MEFFYLLNAVMFFRLFFFFRDKPLTLKPALYLSLLEIIPLLIFNIGFVIISIAVLFVVINLSLFYLEKPGKLNGYRFLSFIVLLIISAVFSSEYFNLDFNSSVTNFIRSLEIIIPSFLKGYKINFYKTLIIISGVLFILNEINFLIRYFFEVLNLYPVYSNEKPVDQKEYNAGRVIGMLERILIFLFVLVNEITVIGFIIAAKGFTRFKELDKRDFAEYVLIGTLLSSFFALIISFLIKSII